MMCPPVRAALVAACLLVLTSATRAQGGRVVVETSPEIPVVGLPAEVSVRFLETRPERVSVFLRPVGTESYTELPGAEISPGVFRAQFQGAVPPQGIEAYAEFVLDGLTLTEPRETPEDNPFRVPAFVPRIQSALSLPARQYRMITVPLLLRSSVDPGAVSGLGSDDPDDVLGDDFGPGADPSQWRLLRFDPQIDRAIDYVTDPEGVGPLRAGLGYWLITAAGGSFDVEAGLSAGVVFDGRPFASPVRIDLRPGWNQIGNPFLFPVLWDDVDQSGLVEDPVAFRGVYEPAQSTLAPWEGYFVFNRGSATALFIDALPRPDGGTAAPDPDESPTARLLRRAGTGAFLVRLRAEHDGQADEAFLGTYGTAGTTEADLDRLSLHKPPAIDTGLRISVRDAERVLAGSFRPAGAQAWDVDVETDEIGARVVLRLDEHGARPEGLGLAVDDLDRGLPLTLHGARADVPAVEGLATRRLRVRLDASAGSSGEASAPDASALGRPSPNPTAGPVAIPYRVAATGPVWLAVYDVLGRRVRVLHDGPLAAGAHEARWDGRDAQGRPVAAGVFAIRLHAAGTSASARVTVLH